MRMSGSPPASNDSNRGQGDASTAPNSNNNNPQHTNNTEARRGTIQSHLAELESTLSRPQARGQAAFASIGSALRSLRRHLLSGNDEPSNRSHTHDTNDSNSVAVTTPAPIQPPQEGRENDTHPAIPTQSSQELITDTSQAMESSDETMSDVATSDFASTNPHWFAASPATASLTAATTANSAATAEPHHERQLIVRLEQAERAHSMGIPLGMLQEEVQRRQEQAEQAVVAQKSNDEFTSGDDDGADADCSNNGNNSSSSSSNNNNSIHRRTSEFLASRRTLQELKSEAVEAELHGDGNDIVLPRTLAMEGSETDTLSGDFWTDSNEFSTTGLDGDDDVVMEDVRLPPTPTSALYSWGIPRHGVSDSNSAADGDERDNGAANTFGMDDSCPQSFHDDGQARALTQARVDKSERLGRYTIVSMHTGPKHSAVVTSTGEVLMSGSNESGQVDPDRRDDVYITRPTLIESLARAQVRQVSCGRSHTAALVSTTGQVLTWGSNAMGQLGRGPSPPDTPHTFCKPAAMVLGPGIRASTIACGHDFTTVLTTRMRVLVCGSQDVVPWDVNPNTGKVAPRYPSGIPVLEGLPLIQVAAGAQHVAVVTQGGRVYSWGINTNGCCGRRYPKSIQLPVSVELPESERMPVRSSKASARSRNFELPDSSQSIVPWDSWEGACAKRMCLPDHARIVHAVCGQNHTILLTEAGSARIFGLPLHGTTFNNNGDNVLVDDFTLRMLDPQLGRKFVDAAAGDSYSLLLDDAGDVWCLRGDQSTCQLECALRGQGIVALSASGRHAAALSNPPIGLIREMSLGSEDSSALIVKDPSQLVTTVESLVPRAKDDVAARAKLIAGTEEFFKSPAVWNSLFYNPDDCRDLYASLLADPSLKQDIATAIERSMLKGLDVLKSDDVRMIYPEGVRVLWLYLQNPLFVSWRDSGVKFDYRGDVILSLCDTMLSLPFEGYRALMGWATSQYNRAAFREYLVKPLIAQMERGLLEQAGARFRAVTGIVAVLKWLHNAAKISGVAEMEDFYSEALATMDPKELYDDLQRFKAASPSSRKQNFFICANPFLLNPTTKRNLLRVEHQVDMLRAAASNITWDAETQQYQFDPYFVIAIDREYILQQTLQKISAASPNDLRKSLRVIFKGEDGVDAGGVTKEFFQLLSQDLFDLSTGMWSTRFGDRVTWFNGDCTWNFDGYYLVGVLVGLALYNGVLLDVHFPHAVYRKLLGYSLGLEDMVDEEIKNGLQALLDYDGDDVEDVFCLNFEVSWSSLGSERRVELKPGGADTPVTASNKEEYVLLYVKWLLLDSIQKQWESFESGVMHVLDGSSLDLLLPDELEQLVVGTTHLDFDALQRNTVYEGGFDANSAVVRNFWKYCQTADEETRLLLLKFATGSPKAPIGGLAALPFKIQRAGPDSAQLPTAHTCFNTLLIPDYGDDYDKLSSRLGRAVLECEGFGLQ